MRRRCRCFPEPQNLGRYFPHFGDLNLSKMGSHLARRGEKSGLSPWYLAALGTLISAGDGRGS